MLEFDLSKSYGGYSLHVAEQVADEWLVLLAPSGAGKSLLLNLISGLTRADGGFVRSEGDTLYARHDVYLKMIEFGDEANPASPMVALEEVPRS